MRTFEFSEGASDKFWNITLAGKAFTVHYGRIGTAGQTQEKTFPDEAKALKEHDKLVAEKLKKGYRETTPKAKAAPASLREALEAALDDNPDDRANWMALADHLAEAGDPRGEFMQVQLALEDEKRPAAERKELAAREAELLKTHRKAWLGPFAALLKKKDDVRWARGWIDALSFETLSIGYAQALRDLPAARFLRSIEAENVESYDPDDDDPPEGLPANRPASALGVLAGAAFGPHLRHLSAGEPVEFGEETYSSNFTRGYGLHELLKGTPRLETFAFFGRDLNLKQVFGAKLPRLRTLIVYHGNDRHPLGVLAANDGMPALEVVRMHPSHQFDRSALPRKDVVAFLCSPLFPALREVHLHASDFGDEGCREITSSGALKRLKVLDLSFGRIQDGGARALMASPDIASLDELDLSYNEITPGFKVPAALADKVTIGHQTTPGQNAYLYSGDIE